MTNEERIDLLERQVEFLRKAIAELQKHPDYDPDTLAWATEADFTWEWSYDKKRGFLRPEYPEV